MNGEPRWCESCGLRVIDPQEFRQRGSRDQDIYCARCRASINEEFDLEVSGG